MIVAPASDVIVVIVTVELIADGPKVKVEASREQVVYSPAVMGVHVSATGPVYPFEGVSRSE